MLRYVMSLLRPMKALGKTSVLMYTYTERVMEDQEFWHYFAYGSNLSRARLEERVGEVNVLCIARCDEQMERTLDLEGSSGKIILNRFQLRFSKVGSADGSGKANVHPKDIEHDHGVEGVVYKLTSRQLTVLDTFEGVPTHYNRQLVKVQPLKEGSTEMMEAITYIACSDVCQGGLLPTEQYLSFIVLGSREHNLSLKAHQAFAVAFPGEWVFLQGGPEEVEKTENLAGSHIVEVGPACIEGFTEPSAQGRLVKLLPRQFERVDNHLRSEQYACAHINAILESPSLLPPVIECLMYSPYPSSQAKKSTKAETSFSSTHFIFVYGTLMQGLANHHILEAEGVEFLGKGKSVSLFYMEVVGLIPFATRRREVFNICGELYKVTSHAVMLALDELEGAPDWYYRHPLEVVLDEVSADGTRKIYQAEIYFCDNATATALEWKSAKPPTEIPDGDYRKFLETRQTSAKR